ncbi:hypothetical protein LJC58_08015 [Lachnospiraceae bacterium OttesenSCG-928-D06]|nr:hypothetical protein [Lachnospiraceae bacterium OttesenSCG-928-D06]
MFLPIILDFENNGLKFMLLKYLRFFTECYKNSWPIITHEEFENYEVNFPNRNEYKEEMIKKYGYTLYKKRERKRVNQYFIPSTFYKQLEIEKGSKLEASTYLLNNRSLELEKILESYIAEISKKDTSIIEGILYFAACPLSLKIVAQKYNIEMIAYETGPIRTPHYRCTTSYFCKEGLYTTHEIENRFHNFKKILEEGRKVPLFKREELLALFLDDKHLKYISRIDKTPLYEVGVAGGCALVVPYFAQSKYMDHELVDDILELYNPSDIIFRLHPGDMYTASYRLQRYEVGTDPFSFLLSSKRIAAVGSNLLFEAMLWKRIPCSKTNVMPATFFCQKSYASNVEHVDTELFVNFFLFSFLVPEELSMDSEYLKWRLSNPTEAEIYLSHLDYYLKKFELSNQWVELEFDARINIIKSYRNICIMDDLAFENSIIFNNSKKNDDIIENENRKNSNDDITEEDYQMLNNIYINLQQEYIDTSEYLNAVLNSTAWKMTLPLRKFMDTIRKKR